MNWTCSGNLKINIFIPENELEIAVHEIVAIFSWPPWVEYKILYEVEWPTVCMHIQVLFRCFIS